MSAVGARPEAACVGLRSPAVRIRGLLPCAAVRLSGSSLSTPACAPAACWLISGFVMQRAQPAATWHLMPEACSAAFIAAGETMAVVESHVKDMQGLLPSRWLQTSTFCSSTA